MLIRNVHVQIDMSPMEIEILEGIPKYLKLPLLDIMPPGTMSFRNLTPGTMLGVWLSYTRTN